MSEVLQRRLKGLRLQWRCAVWVVVTLNLTSLVPRSTLEVTKVAHSMLKTAESTNNMEAVVTTKRWQGR